MRELQTRGKVWEERAWKGAEDEDYEDEEDRTEGSRRRDWMELHF